MNKITYNVMIMTDTDTLKVASYDDIESAKQMLKKVDRGCNLGYIDIRPKIAVKPLRKFALIYGR